MCNVQWKLLSADKCNCQDVNCKLQLTNRQVRSEGTETLQEQSFIYHFGRIMSNNEVTGEQHRISKRPFGSIHCNDRLPRSVSIVALGCSSFSTFFLDQHELPENNRHLELTVDRLDPHHPRVVSWIDAIEYAITVAGITILDTAPWYGHGTSEIVVGWALTKLRNEGKVQREQLTINTKIGRYEADPAKQFDFTARATIDSVERSIRRLCCGSYIDVLQLHDPEFAPSLDLLFQETIPAMIECQTKGYCRALGITGTYLDIFLLPYLIENLVKKLYIFLMLLGVAITCK